ncbi:hypothetical protein K435DRAFT_972839 [Dendrothele bispora CBS 962.96]|uniref:F-box domain-containing protein n=1 Tax=Dendrothele bispora (strain CBS 962.96) TaxID=1314807 RepID=A0A4S8KXE0_DENBC|nr:hypothetical protein K435DRAFT_972839 [Dendrothele bispora CBS 962.96]
MVSITLLNLPVEIICFVLEYLRVREILCCTVVNKRLNEIILQSSSLQFSIELAKFRMRPPKASMGLPYADLLLLLRERERAWRAFIPTTHHRLQLPHSPGAVYDFAGGVYSNGKEVDRRTISVTLYDLPILESGQQRTWTHSLEGLDKVVDFTMDPSQDLLILVALAPRSSDYIYNLHVRSMQTNKSHTLAAAPIFCCMRRSDHLTYIDGAMRIQISGSLVGFLIKEAINSVGGHFEVYNWKTGGPPNGCVVRHSSRIDDFVFLSQDCFLLAMPSGMFEVYSFSDPGLGPSPQIPILNASYAFPALSDDCRYWYICLSSNPSPGYDPGLGEAEHGHNKIYHPCPDERLHACCIYVYRPALATINTVRVFAFVFFFRTATFLHPSDEWTQNGNVRPTSVHNSSPSTSAMASPSSVSSTEEGMSLPDVLAPPLSASLTPPPSAKSEACDIPNLPSPPGAQTAPEDPEDAGRSTLFRSPAPPIVPPVSPLQNPDIRDPVCHVPWEIWGPRNTRWFRECLSKDWQHSIHGLRTVECITDPNADDGSHNGPDGGISGDVDDSDSDDTDEDSMDLDTSQSRQTVLKYLRMRDFNPYNISLAIKDAANPSAWHDYSESFEPQGLASGKNPKPYDGYASKRQRRIITEETTIDVQGVFRDPITSRLPYVEVVTERKYDTTEVMMDDRMVLLLKTCQGGRLRSMDVFSVYYGI